MAIEPVRGLALKPDLRHAHRYSNIHDGSTSLTSFRPEKTQLRQAHRPASDRDPGQRVGALGAGGGAQPQCSEVAGAEAPAGDQGRGRRSPPAALAAVDLGRAQEQRQAVGPPQGRPGGNGGTGPGAVRPRHRAQPQRDLGPAATACRRRPGRAVADRRWRPTRMRTGPQWWSTPMPRL